jgi:glycosyltransferase involved in cell wall biosynthesis
MIHWLKGQYTVTALSLEGTGIEGVESYSVPTFSQGFVLAATRKGFALLGMILVRLGLRRLAEAISSNIHAPLATHNMSALLDKLGMTSFDLIVSHDLVLLPLAFRVRNRPKILFDAREYYPRHYEDRLFWRLVSQPEMDYLCEMYLRKCNAMIAVSEGIAREYERSYRVHPHVMLSLPEYHDLSPTPVQNDTVRIIHHGIVSPSRRLDRMIEMMDYVDRRFSLDLMLVPQKSRCWDKLTKMVKTRTNVRIIPPVAMHEIVAYTNRYDIGLFLSSPTTFNLEFALPNKLFEFIQARLGVAIGPSTEMRKIVEKYDCGIVSQDFEPQSMAEALNELTAEKISYYKQQSHKASFELKAEANTEKANDIVRELIGS